MKQRLLSIVLAVFVLALGFSACSKTTTQPADADGDARQALRTKSIAEYVKANGLKVTQYHDYGWDPVALPTK